MPVQRAVFAALNLYSRSPEAFDEESQETGATFASYAGVAVANMRTAQEAFELLVSLSQNSNRKVPDLAVALVEATEGRGGGAAR